MLYKLPLKNAKKSVIIDEDIYHLVTESEYLKSINFAQNLRLHSSGYVVFQKSWQLGNGKYEVETIYLHKYIAERYLQRPQDLAGKIVARVKNGDKLDCRKRNIEWTTLAKASRKGRTYGETGYRGVRRDGNKYRATIYLNRKAIHIGMYDTAEEAALAYNEKSQEYFGTDGKINSLTKADMERVKHHKQFPLS